MASPISLPAPTLADLLNLITPAEEALLFDHPDPYSLQSLTDNDDETEDEDREMPTITQDANATRLDIESFVDLGNKALIARYQGVKDAGAANTSTATPVAGMSTQSSTPWGGYIKIVGPAFILSLRLGLLGLYSFFYTK